MIQVLLLILKIIGITILAILGLVLLVLALVLFVPVFYRVRIVHNPEQTRIKGRASFLFPLLSVTFEYLKKFSFRAKVFWFTLLDSEKPKQEKKSKKEKKPKNRKKKKKQDRKKEEKGQLPERKAEPESSLTEPEKNPEPTEKTKPAEETKPVEETAAKCEQGTANAPQKEKKPGFFEKIRLKIQKIRETIGNIIKKIKKLLHQKEEVQRILRKPSTKQALAFAWEELKHLLKHILPRKMKGYVAYGADDPATTGQVLGVIGIVYAKTGQLLEIRPNFEEKQLECDVELKGRIQLFTLLVIAFRVFFKEELRQLISDFKNIKEVE